MCWRLLCPFRNTAVVGDEITNILIFGVTGMTGGAVMDAAMGCAWFKVNGFTRANHGILYEELISKGVTVFTGDMSKPHTMASAMKDIDTVFLVTTYWESMNEDREFMQGVNVVNVALENSVKHIIYVGTDYSIIKARERCRYLEGKARVESYINAVGIPFTLVHLGFYFENFLTVFKPHPTGNNSFAVALPMADTPLNCGSVMDFGQCISRIALRPQFYVFKTIKLCTAYLTISEIASKFDRYFTSKTFYNPRIPLSAYRNFRFEGAEEIATMFGHYRLMAEWDRTPASDLIPSCKTFEQWIKENEKALLDTLGEQLNKDYTVPKKVTPSAVKVAQQKSNWNITQIIGQRFKKVSKTHMPTNLVNQEEKRNQQRITVLSQFKGDVQDDDKRLRISPFLSPSPGLDNYETP